MERARESDGPTPPPSAQCDALSSASKAAAAFAARQWDFPFGIACEYVGPPPSHPQQLSTAYQHDDVVIFRWTVKTGMRSMSADIKVFRGR